MNTILVRVQLKPTSQPINHMAVTTYEKGGFYCLLRSDDTVVKYPLADIWRVVEDYGFHLGDNDPKLKGAVHVPDDPKGVILQDAPVADPGTRRRRGSRS